MRLHDLENEEVVLGDKGVVVETALEAGVAFGAQRRRDLRGLDGGQSEFGELVDLGVRRVADPDDNVGQLDRRQVDRALPTTADHLAAAVGARELHDRAPAHRDVILAPSCARLPGRGKFGPERVVVAIGTTPRLRSSVIASFTTSARSHRG